MPLVCPTSPLSEGDKHRGHRRLSIFGLKVFLLDFAAKHNIGVFGRHCCYWLKCFSVMYIHVWHLVGSAVTEWRASQCCTSMYDVVGTTVTDCWRTSLSCASKCNISSVVVQPNVTYLVGCVVNEGLLWIVRPSITSNRQCCHWLEWLL